MPLALSKIVAKRAQILDTIGRLQAHERIVARVGGYTVTTLGEELRFQQARADLLAWCETAAEAAIRARRAEIHDQLGVLVEAKYGIVRGLTLEQVELVAFAELLDTALDERPVLSEVAGGGAEGDR